MKDVKLPIATRLLLLTMGCLQKGWTRGAFARSSNGMTHVSELSPSAASFCIVGAMRKSQAMLVELGETPNNAARATKRAGMLLRRTTKQGLVGYNDMHGRTAAEMIKLVKDTAIASVEIELDRAA